MSVRVGLVEWSQQFVVVHIKGRRRLEAEVFLHQSDSLQDKVPLVQLKDANIGNLTQIKALEKKITF